MSGPLIRHRRRQRRRRKIRITLITVVSVLAVIIAGIGVYALSLTQKIDGIEKIETSFPEESLRPPAEPEGEGPQAQNILLLGSDTRGSISESLEGGKGARSDTMMVVHIPAHRENIQVMSLMRDSWVDIAGHSKAKLNAAMAYGGVPLAVQTIEGIIGSRIDHVAMVDFEGFRGVTNALGGVTLNNPKSFYGAGAARPYFPQGTISLQDGDQALSFVRSRAFEDGDYQRVRNQQLFVKALMGKVLSRETLTNPVTISRLVDAVAPFTAVDSDFNSSVAISLGLELRDVRVDDVRFFTLPTLGIGREGSQSIVKINWGEVPKIQEAFARDTLDEYTVPDKP